MKKRASISLKTPAICGVLAACASLLISGYSFRIAGWMFVITTYVVFMTKLFFAFKKNGAVSAWAIELTAHLSAAIFIAAVFFVLGRYAESVFFGPSQFFEVTLLYGAALCIVLGTIVSLLLLAIRILHIRIRVAR